jgi:hypothetical protein
MPCGTRASRPACAAPAQANHRAGRARNPRVRIRHGLAADLDARADRVKAIAECVSGKVLDHNGDTVRIEIPADLKVAGSCNDSCE